MRIQHLKEKVEYCLEKHPDTRNSDIRLTNSIWVEYYSDKLLKDDKGRYMVRLLDLYDLPTEDHVKRIRAVIQNDEHKFLPTDEKVRRQRKIAEETWREYLGYNPEMREPYYNQ